MRSFPRRFLNGEAMIDAAILETIEAIPVCSEHEHHKPDFADSRLVLCPNVLGRQIRKRYHWFPAKALIFAIADSSESV